MTSPAKAADVGGRTDLLVLLGVSLAFALPILLLPYPPGLDLPWHIAVADILHGTATDGPARYLSHFEVDVQLSSYVAIYYIAHALAYVVGSAVLAFKLLVAAYIVGFGFAVRRLLRSFGGSGVLAPLALPAAYCLTLEFGFFAFALCYPLVFWLWALARDHLTEPAPRRLRLVGVAALSLAIGLVHPLAIAIGAVGVFAIVLATPALSRTKQLTCLAVALGVIPAAIAIVVLGSAGAGAMHGPQQASLWTRLTTHDFASPLDAIATMPARLFGYVPVMARYLFLAIAIAAAVVLGRRAGPVDGDRSTSRFLLLMALLFAALYLATPFTFYWPRSMWAAQPRLLPFLFVIVLLCLRVARSDSLARGVCAGIAALYLCVVVGTLVPFYTESRDFRAVMTASAPTSKTLALIEQHRHSERQPAGLFRNFGAYVVAERGGLVSHLPFDRTTAGIPSALFPVVATEPPPAAPPASHPRSFDLSRHPGWNQILIRDLDPSQRFDFFREHAAEFELVAQRGAWRLHRRVATAPNE